MYPSTSIPILLISAALPIFSYAAPQVPPSSSTTSSTTPAATPDGPYSIMALHSGTSLQFASLTAADQQFFFGGQTQSSCPEEIPEDCPPGNQTVFTPYGSLDVNVPAGQLVYVSPDGCLGFVPTHSATVPENAVIDPFIWTPADPSETAFTGSVTITAFGADGLMGCPNTTSTDGVVSYKVYAAMQNATVPTGDVADCLGVDAVTLAYTGPQPAAWQYD